MLEIKENLRIPEDRSRKNNIPLDGVKEEENESSDAAEEKLSELKGYLTKASSKRLSVCLVFPFII